MDTETLKHLLALREVNKALIDGLKAAVYFLDKVDEITEERRKSMIESRCCNILNLSLILSISW